MNCYIYEKGQSDIAIQCERVLHEFNIETVGGAGSDFAIAPLYEKKIPPEHIAALGYGVLVFHPSLLPIYKGKNAIKDAYKNGDSYTGGTWFWANDRFDAGHICEQEAIPIPSIRPREFYELHIVPLAVRLLRLIITDILRGEIRKRRQLKT